MASPQSGLGSKKNSAEANTMTPAPRFLQRSVLLNLLFIFEGSSLFLLDIVLAATLGLNSYSDILYAAWALPLTIGRGAFQTLTNSLMGLFAGAEDDTTTFSQAISVIGVFALAGAMLMSFTSRWWFPITLPGADPAAVAVGIPLSATLSWLIVLLALAETQRAICYRIDKILIPSVSRVVGTLTSIAVILLTSNRNSLQFIAVGLVAGAAVEMLMGMGGLLWQGVRFRFAWPPINRLRQMTRVVGLPLLGQGLLIFASVGERAIASFMGPGAVTAVTYSRRIFEMLERFVFRGFVIATIQAYTAGAVIKWRRETRFLLLLSIPMFVIFAIMPTAIVSILFERGRFTAESAAIVGTALRAYAVAIPLVAFNRIPFALAFAQAKSRELLIYSIIFATSLIGSEVIMIALGVGLSAFGLAYAVGITVSTAWLYPRVTRNIDAPAWSRNELLRLIAVGVVAFIGTALVVRLVNTFFLGSPFGVWIEVIVGTSVCLLLTFVTAWRLNLIELNQVTGLLKGLS